MSINPGGHLGLDAIIGREVEVQRYWSVLSRQSLVLSAERRIGKTAILHKMTGVGHEGFVPYYQDLERVHSLTELVGQIYRTVAGSLRRLRWMKAKAIETWTALSSQRIQGLSVPDATNNWKILLEQAVTDVLDAVATDGRKVVLMWDEFPLMLYSLREREGADRTIQLLDTLRHLRQSHPDRVRFLFTGSIGLHLVLKALRQDGNANSPINDMLIEIVPPLSDSDTLELVRRLAGDLRLPPVDPEAIGAAVIEALGGFAFHIHHAYDRLDQLGRPATAGDVPAVIDALARDESGSVDLGYTLHRIERYYGDDARLAVAVLDSLATSDSPLSSERLLDLVRHKTADADEAEVRSVCTTLRQDQCIQRLQDGGRHDFRWKLVKRWWQENRG